MKDKPLLRVNQMRDPSHRNQEADEEGWSYATNGAVLRLLDHLAEELALELIRVTPSSAAEHSVAQDEGGQA
jgi:hypothetical protein